MKPDISAAPAPSALATHTGYLLRRAHVTTSRGMHACAPQGLRELGALAVVAEHGPCSQQTLGHLAHLNRSTVVVLVDGLEARGLVRRARDDHDRRAYALTLTEPGRRMLADGWRELDRGEATVTRLLSGAETDRLRRWLRLLLADDPSVAVGSLADRVGYLVAHAHRRMREIAAERLPASLGLHPRDFGLLTALAREQPCSPSHLAGCLGISVPGVLSALGDLEHHGLVLRCDSPTDRRTYDLSLSVTGGRLLEQAHLVAAQIQAELRSRLGAAGDRELRALLARLVG